MPVSGDPTCSVGSFLTRPRATGAPALSRSLDSADAARPRKPRKGRTPLGSAPSAYPRTRG